MEQRVLNYLSLNDVLENSLEFSQDLDVDHQLVIGAIRSLSCIEGLINYKESVYDKYVLSEEGKQVLENGSLEARLFEAVGPNGIELNTIKTSFDKFEVAFGKAQAQKWLKLDKESGVLRRLATSITDEVQNDLKKIFTGKGDVPNKHLDSYKKRKFINKQKVRFYTAEKGVNFSTDFVRAETDLTSEMLATGKWKEASFKDYNLNALGIPPSSGHLHPLMKVRNEFRNIFLQMGFAEMHTNRFVECGFWNFDALFQPQQHPARDAHDTFFISDPANTKLERLPEKYLKAVKAVHSKGGYGSIGYQTEWKEEEATKNILRTHTTAVTARTLYLLAEATKRSGFKPAKYFSLDRVFRNETLDATHLAEFFQIEGVVIGQNISLGNMIGIFTEFFKKLGMSRLRFKPAYNPYTEPSMEIFAFHPDLHKWIEIGNSGVFRPEMLLPMGFPEDVSAVAWGLGLERPTMIKYGISDIRTLCGHKLDLKMVYNSPIFRIESA